ncbi:HAD hydrolase-like protein [Tsuneonella sp. CC-YZS046]|uniref:HAD family hydrolase n=1 Tax=Tsuneonella sp. CC-YZS046 TaxID=3042152 RepID=UPI002D76E918|nr:HAD hydrolase-like protein [Tsuneonella sp. CC-YZS046]WRO65588.1 HAD hydrolase-like protein [Tsuneonella sp. CC-YZS046]
MTRHLIFDLDGTLVDSCAICVDILNEMLRSRGVDHAIDPRFARSYMSQGGQMMVAALLGPACGDPAEDLADFRNRYARMKTPATALFPLVADSLRKLQGMGFILSICSNKPQNLCEQVLRDTGIDDLFAIVVGGRPDLQPKPATDLLEYAMKRLGAAPGECMYVGDSELDYQVAAMLRVPFKFLTYGYAADGWRPADSDCFDCFGALCDGIAVAGRRGIGYGMVARTGGHHEAYQPGHHAGIIRNKVY